MARRVPRASPAGARSAAEQGAVLPYDYGATFAITGRPGNIVQDVINISPDGVFVAVAIGYGFEEERGRPLGLALPQRGGASPASVLPGDLTLGEIPPSALLEGFRINPRFEPHVFKIPGAGGEPGRERISDRVFADELVPSNLLTDVQQPTLLDRVKLSEEISFFFSIVDSGTGRELQDEPTHNLASLGKSNGERPFRLLAQPITFLPRSSIRLQVIERTEGVTGTLFIVLYGYKVLGNSACPETVARSLTGPWQCPAETVGRPSDRIIPFDYVTTIELSGRPKNLVENETTVSADGGFVATSVGYGLLVEEDAVRPIRPGRIEVPGPNSGTITVKNVATGITTSFAAMAGTPFSRVFAPGTYEVALPGATTASTTRIESGKITIVPSTGAAFRPLPEVNLHQLPLRLLPPGALMDGIRIRPEFVRLAFENNAKLATALPLELLDQLFERLNRVDDVSFRYMVFDGGRGRELQNQPLHNIAGLGIANGDRPFKRLARPLVFLPRSTIRIQVEERFGRGKLFFVFQGYKILNPPRGGGRA
jgi:hypothetical protein